MGALQIYIDDDDDEISRLNVTQTKPWAHRYMVVYDHIGHRNAS